MKKLAPVLFVFLWLLQGCTIQPFVVSDVVEVEQSNIVILDNRDPLSIKGGKHRTLDTYFYHADEDIIPSKETLLINTLQSVYGNEESIQVTLTKFDVKDHYPNRLGAARAAGLGAVSPALAASHTDDGNDFISCEIQIEIDGITYESAHTASYEISSFSMMVTDQESYKDAVKEAIVMTLETLSQKLKKN